MRPKARLGRGQAKKSRFMYAGQKQGSMVQKAFVPEACVKPVGVATMSERVARGGIEKCSTTRRTDLPHRKAQTLRVLLFSLFMIMLGSSGCELLQQLLCDPEFDAQCPDPEKAQLRGRIDVPISQGEPAADALQSGTANPEGVQTQSLAPTNESGGPTALHNALADAWTLLRTYAAQENAEKRKSLRTHFSKNATPHRPSEVLLPGWKMASEESWRACELLVRAEIPIRSDREGFAAFLEEALGKDRRVSIRLCNTETLCLADVKNDRGEKISPLDVWHAAQTLQRLPEVRHAEPNRVLQALRTPNDHLYPLQWHYGAMRLPTAWNLSVGDPSVVAAVIDSGILVAHPELAERVVAGADLIDDADVGNDGDGRDNDGNDPGDEACGGNCHSYHGTHVAGTMAARTNNAEMVAGIAWEGRLLAVRALGKGGGALFDIVGGIYWAIGGDVDGVDVNPYPADVLNLSLGGRGDSEIMNEAIDAAVADGAIVVVAAGNDGADASEYTPANSPSAITVAAVGNIGGMRVRPKRTSYSNFGDVVDLAAPGGEQAEDIDNDGHPDGILSTLGEDVEFYQGTSMAAPHVAGVAMLMKSIAPDLQAEAALETLQATANQEVDCDQCGAGMINAAQALRALTGEEEEPLVVPVPDVLRVGRGDKDAEVSFVNEGGRETEIMFSVGGRDRDRIALDTTPVMLGPGERHVISIEIDRNDEDSGEASISAVWEDGEVAEARLLWTDAFVRTARSVQVGAMRLEDDQIIPERIVTASAADTYNFHLFNVPPGDYLIVGVSDDDDDGIFEAHEGVGVYPRIQEPRVVSIVAGEELDGLSFLVAPSFLYEDDQGLGDGDVGAACTSSTDCRGGLYCEGLFTGGYCTQDCSVGNSCPNSSECFCLEDAEGDCGYQICLQSCMSNENCRSDEGYICDGDATCYPQ